MNEGKKMIISSLSISKVADNAGVSRQYLHSVLAGKYKSSQLIAIQLSEIVNSMCAEYNLKTELFTPGDFNADLLLDDSLKPDTKFNVHSIAFSEARTLTVDELTKRFKFNKELLSLLIKVKSGDVPFAAFGGCIIKTEGAF
tara:strand:+ start:432 stop:857 length:426 start_codon:yes stop_codon:yes gene_type:complete